MKKKVREEVKQMIKEAVEEALTVEIQWEKMRDEKTGLPLKHPERRNEKVFLPALITQILPYHEGALRGMQETVDKEVKNSLAFAEKVEAITGIMISHEENLMKFAKFINYVENHGMMIEGPETVEGELIES